ncbi:MAG: hypothetical protein GY915_08490 [bacterium]|nr:hypothetical protein [bacterium]
MLSAYFRKKFPRKKNAGRADALVIREFSIPFLNASGQAMALFDTKGHIAFKTKIFEKRFPEISSIEALQKKIPSENLEEFKAFTHEAFLGHPSKKSFLQKWSKETETQEILIETTPLTEGYTIWRFEEVSSFEIGKKNALKKEAFEKSLLPQIFLNSEAQIQNYNEAFKDLVEQEEKISNFKSLLSYTSVQQIFSQGKSWENLIEGQGGTRFELSLKHRPDQVFQAYASKIDEQSYLLQLIDYTEQKNFHLKMLEPVFTDQSPRLSSSIE